MIHPEFPPVTISLPNEQHTCISQYRVTIQNTHKIQPMYLIKKIFI